MCRTLELVSIDSKAVCASCRRPTRILPAPILDEGAARWVKRLGHSLPWAQLPVSRAAIEALRLVGSHPDVEAADVAHVLRQLAGVDPRAIRLPVAGVALREGVALLIAVFEAAAKADLSTSGIRRRADLAAVAGGEARPTRAGGFRRF